MAMETEGSRIDIVIFGASGFTGQFVVEDMARVADEEKLTWAVAGRNMERLRKVLDSAAEKTGKSLERIPIMIADVMNDTSLLEMCQKARVILNCVGPYRFYGEKVVKACIECETHHLDISGEPQFLEKMQLQYHGLAKEKGIYIIGSCGFDSVPAEMGIQFTRDNFKGDLNEISTFVEFMSGPEGSAVNYSTYESAVYGFAHSDELKVIRKALFTTPFLKFQHKQQIKKTLFYSKEMERYCVPMLSSDRSVVYRSQRYNYEQLHERPVQFMIYLCQDSIISVIVIVIAALIFAAFARFAFGRSMLLKYPGIFTNGLVKRGGPSRKQMEGASFTMTFRGKGYATKQEDHEKERDEIPNQEIVTKLTGPDPGYVTTPICLIQCALILLKEQSQLPEKGGVYSPGVAFRETSLIKRLESNNMKFLVVQQH